MSGKVVFGITGPIVILVFFFIFLFLLYLVIRFAINNSELKKTLDRDLTKMKSDIDFIIECLKTKR